jgi:CBS-domain-containing membrane protein
MSTTVKDVMTTRVVSVNKCVSVKEIAASLKRYRVSGFPVVDHDRTVLGVVSATDLDLGDRYVDAARQPARTFQQSVAGAADSGSWGATGSRSVSSRVCFLWISPRFSTDGDRWVTVTVAADRTYGHENRSRPGGMARRTA